MCVYLGCLWHYSLSTTYQSEPLFLHVLLTRFRFSISLSHAPLPFGLVIFHTAQCSVCMYVFHKCCMQRRNLCMSTVSILLATTVATLRTAVIVVCFEFVFVLSKSIR